MRFRNGVNATPDFVVASSLVDRGVDRGVANTVAPLTTITTIYAATVGANLLEVDMEAFRKP